MSTWIRPAFLLFFCALLAVTARAQNSPQSSSDDRPVLKRRPSAEQTDQQTSPPASSPAPSPTPAPQSSGSGAPTGGASQPSMHSAHDHHADVMHHGAEAMGFNQETTTHHFLVTRGGGVIRVIVNDSQDTDTAAHISMHLRELATQFAQGNFSAPEHTHGQMPPGVATMQQLRHKIIYTPHAIQDGAELIISSQDSRAVYAIHQFLEFQIREHQTGDPIAAR